MSQVNDPPLGEGPTRCAQSFCPTTQALPGVPAPGMAGHGMGKLCVLLCVFLCVFLRVFLCVFLWMLLWMFLWVFLTTPRPCQLQPCSRQASSRCLGQSESSRGQISMLGGRLLPLPKPGQSFPQDGVSQQAGDNGKMLRQHSWQPSAAALAAAAPAPLFVGKRDTDLWSVVGREQEQHRPWKGGQSPAWMGHR